MQAKLFISDLHLSEQRPDTLALFQYFLRERVADTDELYVLGDLFDAWLGDDDDSALGDTVRAALRSVSARGTRVRIQHGNRDFLLGDRFAEESGCELLDETVVIDVGGEPTLLMHGDLLCTDDKDYQQARSTLRAPAFVAEFLARPLAERVAIAADKVGALGQRLAPVAIEIQPLSRGLAIDDSTVFLGKFEVAIEIDLEISKLATEQILPRVTESSGRFCRSESAYPVDL